jgi:chromosome segregation ATPase
VDALQAQHDAEIAIINDQLANDIPALQAALDALTLKQQEDVDALTIAYTAAIEAAQTETTEEFLGILEDYVTSENLTETLSDYVTNEGLAETLESYVNKIEDGYNQLLEDYGDLQDQLDQASSQYEVDALAIQMEEMRDKIDNYIDQTGYNPQTGTVTGGDGTGGDGTGDWWAL